MTTLDRSRQEVLLVEYEKAQDSAEHHDNIVMSLMSLHWIGSAVLLGFVVGVIGSHPDWKYKTAAVGLGVVGVLITSLVYMWANQQAHVKRQKYQRCKAIEQELGMVQHTALDYRELYMKRGFKAITGALIGVWVLVVVLALLA